MKARDFGATRRVFLGALAAAGVVAPAHAEAPKPEAAESETIPFFGPKQAGIVTPTQLHAYFVAFNVKSAKRAELASLMKIWSAAAAAMSEGNPPPGPESADYAVETDGAEMQGLSASRLTITFGFGASLFAKDRFGLAAQRPEAFVDLPIFPGEQLAPARTGGDLFAQICADNPQVAFHAVRALARLAYGVADMRWIQAGFVSDYGQGKTPRNLMGFKDGTGNPPTDDSAEMEAVVWAGAEAPAWMRGGSYVVVRRARMALEHWERTRIAFQEQTFGRRKGTGAPLGRQREGDVVDIDAKDGDGNLVVPENSHVGITRRASLDGTKILRRSYSYDDGANITAERWPPWRQGMEFDAGLVFVCYQRDPRNGFIPIFEKLARFDMMNQFVTNTGGGYFACPGGALAGDYVGRALLEG